MNYLTPEQIEEMKEIEALKKVVMRKVLTKDALQRLGRIKLIKPELAEQLELYLLQLYQGEQIKTVIDDSQLKKILESLTNKKRFNIIR